jgi:hypothetical protein
MMFETRGGCKAATASADEWRREPDGRESE